MPWPSGPHATATQVARSGALHRPQYHARMSQANSPQIRCPHCHQPFALDETLAGPVIAEIRHQAEKEVQEARRQASDAATKLATQTRELAEREASLQAAIDLGVAAASKEMAAKARQAAQAEVQVERASEQARLQEMESKVQQAQATELDAINRTREADERQRALDLEVARLLQGERAALLEKAGKDLSEGFELRIAEKDQLIARLKDQADEMKRKAEAGSQQLQGDVLELEL